MRQNKFYPGIVITLVMAVLLEIPAMAAEDTDAADYNGFHQDEDTGDWYYYTEGQIDTGVTDVIKGTVDDVTGWWNVVNGKVVRAETVAKNANGWWYIDANGMVDFSYNGFAENENGLWYCENGAVTFAKQDILKDTTGAIGEKGAWYYVIGNKVQKDFTGLSNFRNANGWWYIKDGKVDFSHNGVDKNQNGWYYVTGGKVQFGFTGLANYKNENGWWYIGDGRVDFSYNGLASNCNGVWYLAGGKVNFSFNNTYDIGDTTYTVAGGKVVLSSHRAGQYLTQLDLDILTSKKGTVLSRTLAQNEFNQIISLFMNSSYVKNTAYNSTSGGFIWNGGDRWDCSSATLYLMNDYLLTYDETYSVGKKAAGAYPETGSAAPTNSVSQAMSWGNPVYTYETIGQLFSDSPGSLRYGDLLYYGTISGSTIKISHTAVYLGQYYLENGDEGYYQLENDDRVQGSTKEGRSDGVRISPLRTTNLVHVARIF